jgi:hypothetical protein
MLKQFLCQRFFNFLFGKTHANKQMRIKILVFLFDLLNIATLMFLYLSII